jgi:hypothetical protein
MAKFKCIHTGNIVEFTAEHDSETMRKHAEYVEVVDTPQEVKPTVTTKKVKQDATSIGGNDTNNSD